MNAVDEMSPLLSFIERFNQFCAFFLLTAQARFVILSVIPLFKCFFSIFLFFLSVCHSSRDYETK